MKPFPPFIIPSAGAYLVGGCVRDLLLGRSPTDYDVAVEDSPADYAAALAAPIGGRVVVLGKAGARTWRVAAGDLIVDVCPIQGDSIRDDLLRRDFTINAMAVATVGGEVVDVAEGREDLAHRTIRMVSRSVFRTDPVRLIRAFRFAAQLGFAIEAGTRDAVRGDAGLIARSAGERIRDEFYKLIGAEHHVSAVADMAATGLLTAVFPELASTRRCGRGPAGIGRLVVALPPRLRTTRPAADAQGFSARRRVLLRCGLVFHPLGGSTHEPERTSVFDRLRCPNRDRDHLDRLLTLQRMPMRLFETVPAPAPRDEVRFFLAAGDTVPDLLLQEAAWFRSDRHASRRAPQRVRALYRAPAASLPGGVSPPKGDALSGHGRRPPGRVRAPAVPHDQGAPAGGGRGTIDTEDVLTRRRAAARAACTRRKDGFPPGSREGTRNTRSGGGYFLRRSRTAKILSRISSTFPIPGMWMYFGERASLVASHFL